MKIILRTRTGWSGKVNNTSASVCDLDGAALWEAPGGRVYCDRRHDAGQVALAEAKPMHRHKWVPQITGESGEFEACEDDACLAIK